MNKGLFLTIILGLSTILSGCMATSYVSKKSQKTELAIEFSDNFLAIGKPKTPILNHENALVMVGEKYNYLVEDFSRFDEQKITKVFNYLDLNRVRIRNISQIRSEVQYYFTTVTLDYSKPKAQITQQEFEVINKINASGFGCIEEIQNNVEYLSCPLHLAVKISPIKKAENQFLQHSFAKPIKADFYAEKYHMKPTMALMPLAFVVDVVTLPIQIVKAFEEAY